MGGPAKKAFKQLLKYKDKLMYLQYFLSLFYFPNIILVFYNHVFFFAERLAKKHELNVHHPELREKPVRDPYMSSFLI
jgi:hypothetical protein